MSSEDFSVSLPKAIDYTSRDFNSIKADLIQRIKDTNRLSNWVGEDPADFGVVMVESFAYLGDLMSYYIDRIANEAFIGTAVKPSSVYSLAQSYGYTPVGYRQSVVTVEVTNTDDTDPVESITLPAGTVFSGDVVIGDAVFQVYFTSTAEIEIEPGETVSVDAVHGKSVTLFPITMENTQITDEQYGELLAISNAEANMTFELSEGPVVDGTVEVFVKDGGSYTQWTRVNYLMDSGPTDLVFTTFFTSNNEYYVQFGDGISGAIPAADALIQARYTVGGGTLGNIPANTLNEIVYVPGVSDSSVIPVTVNNSTPALGGYNPESLEEIRLLAPLTIRANNRAVTLQDFESLALSVTNVGKAKAVGTSPTSVVLYVAPNRSVTDNDSSPGIYNENAGTENPPNFQATQELIDLKADVLEYLSDKVILGTTVTMADPEYLDVHLDITYRKFSQFTKEEVEAGIYRAILRDFNYAFLNFGETIYAQDIEFLLQGLRGIRYAKVNTMWTGDVEPSDAQAVVTSANNQILRFTYLNITLSIEE